MALKVNDKEKAPTEAFSCWIREVLVVGGMCYA